MKNKVKKMSGVVLFSAILSVGLGFIPTTGNVVAYAESTNPLFPNANDDVIKNVFSTKVKIYNSGNTQYYISQVQKIDDDSAITLNLNDPQLEKNGKLAIMPNSFGITNSFKKGDEIKVRYTIKDPLKQSYLLSYNDTYIGGMMKEQLKQTPFMFSNENPESDTSIATPTKVDVNVNEEGTEGEFIFTIKVPKDTKYMFSGHKVNLLDRRNFLTKDLDMYEKLNKALDSAVSLPLITADVHVTDSKDNNIVDPFRLANFNITKNKDEFAEKNNDYFKKKDLPYFVDLNTLFVKNIILPQDSDQGVKANVLNGGITGGIVNPEVGKDLSIKDVDFGKLSIGQVIEPVKEDKMVSVRDWTGGNGWKLTAQHKEADRNQSLQLGVQVDKNTKVDLNNEPQLVTTGDSQLETITQGGEYYATWGTHPTVGEFNNVIEWNLSANVTE